MLMELFPATLILAPSTGYSCDSFFSEFAICSLYYFVFLIFGLKCLQCFLFHFSWFVFIRVLSFSNPIRVSSFFQSSSRTSWNPVLLGLSVVKW